MVIWPNDYPRPLKRDKGLCLHCECYRNHDERCCHCGKRPCKRKCKRKKGFRPDIELLSSKKSQSHPRFY